MDVHNEGRDWERTGKKDDDMGEVTWQFLGTMGNRFSKCLGFFQDAI